MILTQENAKELFAIKVLVKGRSTNWIAKEDEIHESLVTQSTIDYYSKYYKNAYQILEIKPRGRAWPENAVVECTSSSSPYRCYTKATYKITSPKRLTERDLEILRAQGAFMTGQVTGSCDISAFTQQDGLYVYSAHSVCDSSD